MSVRLKAAGMPGHAVLSNGRPIVQGVYRQGIRRL